MALSLAHPSPAGESKASSGVLAPRQRGEIVQQLLRDRGRLEIQA
jgi:hypothetical protein